MKALRRRIGPLLMLAATVAASAATTQQRPQVTDRSRDFYHLPAELKDIATTLGDRMVRPGKECTILVADFTDAAGARRLSITHEMPNLVRIDGLAPGRPSLLFDGSATHGTLNHDEETLLETFADDSAEGFLQAYAEGSAMRLLGQGFGPDPRVVPKYTGVRYDIYEVSRAVRTDMDKTVRLKRYYFDSRSGFLLSTRYQDTSLSRSVTVETRFSNWQSRDGSFYPGRIERFEDKRPIFSLNVLAASSEPARGAATFRQ